MKQSNGIEPAAAVKDEIHPAGSQPAFGGYGRPPVGINTAMAAGTAAHGNTTRSRRFITIRILNRAKPPARAMSGLAVEWRATSCQPVG